MAEHIHKWAALDQKLGSEDNRIFGPTVQYYDVCTRCGIVRVKEEYVAREGGVVYSDMDKPTNSQTDRGMAWQ